MGQFYLDGARMVDKAVGADGELGQMGRWDRSGDGIDREMG